MKIHIKIKKKIRLNNDKDHDNNIDKDNDFDIDACIKSLKDIFNKNSSDLDKIEENLNNEKEDDKNLEVNFLNNQIKFYKKRLERKDQLIEKLSPRFS